MRKTLLFGLPLLLAALLLLLVLALPAFVASTAHRATIEALASSLTGRQVHIAGRLRLVLLPRPQLVAEQVSINGRAGQSITARSLTLDVALEPLATGRLIARSLTLQSPTISLPWPLPANGGTGQGGLRAPPWLAAMHAQIENGRVAIGALNFTHVSADIFTAGNGAASLAGSATLAGQPLALSLGLGPAGAAATSLSLDISGTAGFAAHLSGAVEASRHLHALLSASFMAPGANQKVAGTAIIDAYDNGITTSRLSLTQGDASLSGAATLAFTNPRITATLCSRNLDLTALLPWIDLVRALPIQLHVAGANARLAGLEISQLSVDAQINPRDMSWRRLSATLPGGAVLASSGRIDAGGNLSGQASLNTADLPALLAATGTDVAIPPPWRQISLQTDLAGHGSQLRLTNLAGTAGDAKLDGNLALSGLGGRTMLAGRLHLDRLDLASLASLLQNPPPPNFGADLEITAGDASLGAVPMTNLLIDAAFDHGLTIRRLSASLFGGLLDGNLATDMKGDVTTARAMMSLPSGAKLAALAPETWQIPAPLAGGTLAVSLLAQGPFNALVTSATLNWGQVSITAAPVVDLPGHTATGAFTLRHPSAITALNDMGLQASQAWPGAGSVSLRADLAITPTRFALPDFVLSLGSLTAEGKASYDQAGRIQASIDADTLALPPVSAPAWDRLFSFAGQIDISQQQIWLGGKPVAGAGTERLVLARHLVTLAIPALDLAGGTLAGTISAAIAPKAPLALAVRLGISRADGSAFNLPVSFPLTLPTGSLSARVNLLASGAGPQDWLGTLAGTADLQAANGTLGGFSLAGMAQALASKYRTLHLRAAAGQGITRFQTVELAGSFADGIFTLSKGTLAGADGEASMAGAIDIPRQSLGLALSLAPTTVPATMLQTMIKGPWSKPTYSVKIKPSSQQ